MRTVLVMLAGLGFTQSLVAQPESTRMLAQPAVSATQVAFTLRRRRLDREARRQRRPPPHHRRRRREQSRSSPTTAAWLAFAGNYDGNVDVYVVPVRRRRSAPPHLASGQRPAAGLHPRRQARPLHLQPHRLVPALHPALDRGDERRARGAGSRSRTRAQAAYSPDGRSLAYNPIGRAFEQWKGYRGGRVSQLWLINTSGWDIEKVPQPAGPLQRRRRHVARRQPGLVPFRPGGRVQPLSLRPRLEGRHPGHQPHRLPGDVRLAGGGQDRLRAGRLALPARPESGKAQKLAINVPADLRETRPRWVEGRRLRARRVALAHRRAGRVRDAGRDRHGARPRRAIPRNLTNTPGANEKSPAWSPDGQQIAFFSDQGGENRLHIAPADGKGAAPRHSIPPAPASTSTSQWSPDGKRMAWRDNSQSIFVMDVATARARKVGVEQDLLARS